MIIKLKNYTNQELRIQLTIITRLALDKVRTIILRQFYNSIKLLISAKYKEIHLP